MNTSYHFAHHAMATKFDLFISGEDKTYAGQAAEAAFEAINLLESLLSKFQEGSDIWRLNHVKASTWCGVSIDTWNCLDFCKKVSEETCGAFDITIGPLFRCWRDAMSKMYEPDESLLQSLGDHVGMHLYTLDEEKMSVWVHRENVEFDLGGIGKGYALDYIADLLIDDWGVERVLMSAGGSTILALDSPEDDDEGWDVGMGDFEDLPSVKLKHASLSGSGMNVKGQHIIDPRTSKPVKPKGRAWAMAQKAIATDALSTAFMVMESEEINEFCTKQENIKAMVWEKSKLRSFGKFIG